MSPARIDIKAVAAAADLPAMLRDEGIELRRGMALCPFHDNTRSPALSVYFADDGRWRFKCHSCGAAGDAVEWHARRHEIGVADAARELGERLGIVAPAGPTRTPAIVPRPILPMAPRPAPAPPEFMSAAWQRDFDAIVCAAEAALWSPAGRPFLGYLRRRGFQDWTIGALRFGLIARDGRTATARISYEAGILLPWEATTGWYSRGADPDGPRWCGGTVRRFGPGLTDPPEKKYKSVSGSSNGFGYPFTTICPGVPTLICEGHFDAALAFQEIGHMVNCLTIGGGSNRPKPETRSALARSPWWLVLPDADQTGWAAFAMWFRIDPAKCKRLPIPAGCKDLTNYHQAGADLRSWMASAIAEHVGEVTAATS